MEPYDRGDGKQTQPGDELQSKWKLEVELAELFPTFYKAIASYPAEQPPEMQNLVFWVKERFESKWSTRSAFLLEHHAWLVADDHILLGLRQFFVGHTYNAQYGVSLVLPHEDGVVVFNWVDLTSDLAVRYVPFIALPIAQKIMRTQLKARYQDLLEDLPQ